MPILLTCECGKRLKVRDELAGKRVRCPECQTVVTVPAATGVAPATKPSVPAPKAAAKAPPAPHSPPSTAVKKPAKSAPPPIDDEDEGFPGGDDEPPARSKAPARAAARSAISDDDDDQDDDAPTSKSKPAKSGGKSKLPLILAGVLVLALAGAAGAFFMGLFDGTPSRPIAKGPPPSLPMPSNIDPVTPPGDPMGTGNPGDPTPPGEGKQPDASNPPDEGKQPGDTKQPGDGKQPADGKGSSVAGEPTNPGAGNVGGAAAIGHTDLPADSIGFVSISVGAWAKSKSGQEFLKGPIGEKAGEGLKAFGLSLDDIDVVRIALPPINELDPNQAKPKFISVQTKKDVDWEKLATTIAGPDAKKNKAGKDYFLTDVNPDAPLAVPTGPRGVVLVFPEVLDSYLEGKMKFGAPIAKQIAESKKHHIFVVADLPEKLVEQGAAMGGEQFAAFGKAKRALVVLNDNSPLALNVDLTFSDAKAAEEAKTAVEGFVNIGKFFLGAKKDDKGGPPEMAKFLAIGNEALKNFKASGEGNTLKLSTNAPADLGMLITAIGVRSAAVAPPGGAQVPPPPPAKKIEIEKK